MILCFEKHFSKQNSIIRLKSSILAPPKFLGWLSYWKLTVLETEKQLQHVAINPGWQSNSYFSSYIVARFTSLLTFFRCKSLHCRTCVAMRNLAVC